VIQRRYILRWLVLVACVSPVVAGGCHSGGGSTAGPVAQLQKSDQFDPVVLTEGTNRLLEQFYVDAVGVSGIAARDTNDIAVREDSIRWRINVANQIDALRLVLDPRVRFLALWTFTAQLRIGLTEGPGRERFGKVQQGFVEFARNAEAKTVALGYDSFPDAEIDASRPEVDRLAREAGANGWIAPALLGRVKTVQPQSELGKLLSLPLAPISGLQGVGNTPEAINNFADATNQVSGVLQRLPERTRWQAELLLLETASSGAVESVVKEAIAMRQEIDSLKQVVQQLPGQVRTETEATLKAVDAAQPQLQATIAKVQGSMELANATAGKIDTTVTNVRGTLGELQRAAAAVQGAAAESLALTRELQTPTTHPSGSGADQGEAIRAVEVEAAAKQVQAAVVEIRQLLTDLSKPTAVPAVTSGANRLDELVSKITWNIGALIVLMFACALLYVVLVRAHGTRVLKRRRELRK
jgi:hypothetical protein